MDLLVFSAEFKTYTYVAIIIHSGLHMNVGSLTWSASVVHIRILPYTAVI